MKNGKAETKSFLIEVELVSKAAGPSTSWRTLSYFSTTRLAPGTLVKVPVRNRLTLAIVLRSRDVKSAKSDIRRAGFLLKKIRKSDILEADVPKETLQALEKTASYYSTSVGTLLTALLPKVMQDAPETYLKSPQNFKKKKLAEHSKEILLLQMEPEERFGQYRALVRQCFARGSSCLFVVPTHLEIENVKVELSKGIEEFVYTWSLGTKKEAAKKAWLSALNDKHPILLITTPAGILFPRADVDTIIVERENSRAYRTLARPFINLKYFIESLTKSAEKQLAMGDSVLSLETLWKEKNGEYSENSLIRWRLPGAPSLLADTKTKQNENGRFEIIGEELKALLEKAFAEKEKVFLFGARKGLAPTTVCGDCGTLLPCLNCGAGVVLHRHGEATVYICHACGSRRESTTTCGYCGSWKLVPLGVGTEQIARAVKELFPKQHVLILDKDYATTDKQAREIVERFQKQGGVLVGTELAFYHLDSVAYSGLVSVDTLFSIPDFGINERIFYIVSRLREMARKEVVIQTRNIGKQILAWATFGNIIDFYQNEIAERESLLYPPFSIFIKVTAPPREIGKLKELLTRWHPDILRDSIIIRVPRQSWPDKELIERLTLLGPEFSIKVDPESIL